MVQQVRNRVPTRVNSQVEKEQPLEVQQMGLYLNREATKPVVPFWLPLKQFLLVRMDQYSWPPNVMGNCSHAALNGHPM